MKTQAAVSFLKPHFRYPLADPAARSRFLVGSALLLAGFLVPIVPALFALGYAMQVMRRTTEGEPPAMQDWSDWGGMLKQGFRFWVVSFVYLLPGLVVILLGLGVYFASVFGVAIGGSESNAAVMAVLLSLAAMFISLAVGTLLIVVGSVPMPAVLAHVAAEDSLGAAFRFRQWWRVWRHNALGFLIAWVILMGLASVSYLVLTLAYYTLVLICVIPLLLVPIYFYLVLVAASLTGELYAESRASLAEAGPA